MRAFAQIQDVRVWGEETNTLADFSADRFDLHQAWVELGRVGALDTDASVVRMVAKSRALG